MGICVQNLNFLQLSISEFRADTDQTDGQTDKEQYILPFHYGPVGRRHNKIETNDYKPKLLFQRNLFSKSVLFLKCDSIRQTAEEMCTAQALTTRLSF